jgi:hypothetical protein
MQRSLSMYDSPELAMVAEQLGLGHPTGQPIHTMLGWIASKIGPDPLISINALSAIVGALTLIPAMSLTDALRRQDAPSSSGHYAAPLAIAVIALHPMLWEPATRIEVYPLAVFGCMWAAARSSHAMVASDPLWPAYAGTGLALGLAATSNPYAALGTAIAMTPRLLMALVRREVPLSSLATIVPAGLIGLIPYAYVPLIARRFDVVVWGRPDSLEALLRYFIGTDYGRSRELTCGIFLENLRDLLLWANRQGIVALLLMGALGYAVSWRRHGLGGVFYALCTLFFCCLVASNAVFAPDVLDYLGYLALPGWLGACGVGLLVAGSCGRGRTVAIVSVVAVLALLALSKPTPWERTRHLDDVTEVIAERALQSAPEGAILIVQSDHWAGPLWYLQEQRGLRPDVVVLAYGLSSSSWYWEHLFSRHPDLERVQLRGGHRTSRVRKFLAANPSRPVRIEHIGLAQRLELNTCLGHWLWGVPPDCEPVETPALMQYVAEARRRLKQGSPGTTGLLAALAFHQGYGLQAAGYPRAAVRALIAATPASMEADSLDLSVLPERTYDPALPLPNYATRVALGDPARNLDLASRIAAVHGAESLARQLKALSGQLGAVEQVAD